MQTTGNLGLKKPEGTDVVDIADLNGNADILDTAVSNKVDKVAGKQLSTEDYMTAEKTKLAGVAAGANAYVHPANHPASVITQDASNRFVTDAEKTAWNAKASTAAATTSAAGLQSAADKVKLDGIAAGAGRVNSATDPVIGTRTIDDTITAAAGADTPTRLWSKLANMIKGITGSSNWYTLPSMTITSITTALETKANLASPAFTGTPTAPTAVIGTNTTQLATTAFVKSATDSLNIARKAQADDTTITTTSETIIATFTPTSNGNFLIGIYMRALTAATITIRVTYADVTGAQSTILLNAQAVGVGSYSLLPCYINAVTSTPIAVKVTSNIASQVEVSATIMGV